MIGTGRTAARRRQPDRARRREFYEMHEQVAPLPGVGGNPTGRTVEGLCA